MLNATPTALDLLYAEAYELVYLPEMMPEIAGVINREYARLGHCMTDDMRHFVTDQPLHYQLAQECAPFLA